MSINLLLYFVVVLIWGTTWLAIKFQLGEVSKEISIFYRFAMASILLLSYCKMRGVPLRFGLKDHGFFFLLGLGLFSAHMIFVYAASEYLVSGLVSVIFSLVCVFNIFNSFLFFKKKPEGRVVIGACIGLCGLALFFWKDLATFSWQSQTLFGAALVLASAFTFSLGNIISKKNQKSTLASCAFAMGYGAIIMFVSCLFTKAAFVFPVSLSYWSSLLYLVILGSIIAFLCYLRLIDRIGPERAGYVTVFSPIIALFISLLFENYRLTTTDLLGVVFILMGNFLVMGKKKVHAFESPIISNGKKS